MNTWRAENVRCFSEGVIRNHRGPVWRANTTLTYYKVLEIIGHRINVNEKILSHFITEKNIFRMTI